MMYSCIRKALFKLDPERAHYLSLASLQLVYRLGLTNFIKPALAPRNIMGLTFKNPIGLAAGFDKNADYIDALASLGFGFIEVGTVTPKPQLGNPKPRLFRLPAQEAIINRMGFNNKGVEYVAKRLSETKYRGILGINIGKNKNTSLDHALDDYLFCFRQLSIFASYITINISSPNTQGLRDLQQEEFLIPLITALKKEQQNAYVSQKKYVPLVVKIAPDLTLEELQRLATLFLELKIDGVIATNTTISRGEIVNESFSKEVGGLSGQPLFNLSTRALSILHEVLQGKIPLIASGGVMDEKDADEKIKSGAQLLQVYTGLVYKGPSLIKKLAMK